VFSVDGGGFSLNVNNGQFLINPGATVSMTGFDTPLHSGGTVNGDAGGLVFEGSISSSDTQNWYIDKLDLRMESGFSFTGGLGDVPIFQYKFGPTWDNTSAFNISKSTLHFDVPLEISLDPRVLGYYGLGPPCLADPSLDPLALECPDTRFVSAILDAQGAPLVGFPGIYTFAGTITTSSLFVNTAPEPAAVIQLATVLIGVALLLRRRCSRSNVASGWHYHEQRYRNG
jgi:hypothetical protein